MKYLRIIDEIGNKEDVGLTFVPRIGELIVRRYGSAGDRVKDHYFRVKDVVYKLDDDAEHPEHQVAILVAEEPTTPDWL